MGYWEIAVDEVREVLRLWLGFAVGLPTPGLRTIAAHAGVDRNHRLTRLHEFSDEPHWPTALASSFRHWSKLANNDFDRLVAVVSWLIQNPNSGLLIRQLPIPGVDTKWLGSHRAAVNSLAVPLGIPEHLGLRERDMLRAVAILDPALRKGLPRLLAASDLDLANLKLAAPRVLVVENLQTLEALPDLPDTVAIFGWGSNVSAIADFPWVRGAQNVLYWGDLDTDGFAILTRFRARRPCDSLLMDRETLAGWRDLAVPHPAGELVDSHLLTDEELAALHRLHDEGLRLEQERIPIEAAVSQILLRPLQPKTM